MYLVRNLRLADLRGLVLDDGLEAKGNFMTRIALALSLSLLAVPACKKKEDAGKAAADKTAEKAAPAEPASGPVKSDPQALWTEFTAPSHDVMALSNKYHDGASFSAKVSVKGAEEDGKPILWVDIDGKNHMALDYTDVAKAKAIKDGDTVNVSCKIGGADANSHMMMMTDCK
jgi:hypothetical protein